MPIVPSQPDHLGSSSSVSGVYAHEINNIWPKIESQVSASCKKGGGKYLAEDIRKCLVAREMQLWVATNAFAITEIINYPQKSCLRINIGGGSNYQKFFGEFIKTAERWAKTHKCRSGEAVTRQGYEQLFKLFGWRKSQIYMEKEF